MAALWAPWNPLVAAALYPPPEAVMYRCSICRFEVTLDDVEILGTHTTCICVSCFRRETRSEKPMDKRLRQQLMQTLNEVSN